jgi:homeobox protein YOX1/YHP1
MRIGSRQAQSSLPYYEQPDQRYLSQAPIPSYPSRSFPLPQSDPYSSRRHNGPVSVSPPITRDDRWQPNPAYPTTGQVQVSGNVIPSSGAYATPFDQYAAHQSASYSYPAISDARVIPHEIPPVNPMHMVPSNMDRNMAYRVDTRGDSPYARNPSSVSPPNYMQQSPSTPVSEEPSVKKKRKRADAAQLEVLNETYNRTAFPSTDERAELARKLDMTPRSVQIWYVTSGILFSKANQLECSLRFQNKR